jgi:beta-galactosidase
MIGQFYQAFRDTGDFKRDVLGSILRELNIQGVIPSEKGLSYGVTAHKRTDGETEYVFLMNFADTEKQITVDGESITLSPREVKLHTR